MKILYLANVRMPTEKAHGIQITRTCEALADNGAEVLLLVPKRRNNTEKNAFNYYNLKKNFEIKYVFSVPFAVANSFMFRLESVFFSLQSLWCIYKEKPQVIYSRDEFPLLVASFCNIPVYWETHMGHRSFVVRAVIKRAKKVFAISQGLIDNYSSEYKLDKKRFMALPDAVNIEQFNISNSREACRKKLDLPLNKKIVLYSGHLYDWKGAHVLAAASKHLSDDVLFVFVGGTDIDVNNFRNKYENSKKTIIRGHCDHALIPFYLRAADILSIPNSGKKEISRKYTSPMKLFEYMASKTPVVASDLPSIREIIDDDCAWFFAPDNSEDLARVITKVLDNYGKAEEKSMVAFNKVRSKHTWDRRAKIVIDNIKQR